MDEKKTKKPKPRRTRKYLTRDFRDYDYWQKLSTEERAWLNKFDSEYYLLYLEKRNNLHKGYSRLKLIQTDKDRAQDISFGHTSPLTSEPSSLNPEDALINWIDSKKK